MNYELESIGRFNSFNLNSVIKFKPTAFGETIIQSHIREELSNLPSTSILRMALSCFVEYDSETCTMSKIDKDYYLDEEKVIHSSKGTPQVEKLLKRISLPRDNQGFIEMQLWEFCNMFGKFLRNGAAVPCVNNVIYIDGFSEVRDATPTDSTRVPKRNYNADIVALDEEHPYHTPNVCTHELEQVSGFHNFKRDNYVSTEGDSDDVAD